MIVLDSSILVAIVKGEEGSGRLLELLAAEDCAIGTPTLVETRAWCAMNLAGRISGWLEDFINHQAVAIIPFGRDMADVASQAFARFGKGSGHPARLNFGDCMAYAVSAVMRAPLLFKGEDFGQTDVSVHSGSIYGR
jgi:ribonuclease VapC